MSATSVARVMSEIRMRRWRVQTTPSASDETERDFKVDGNEAPPLGAAIRSRRERRSRVIPLPVKMEERGVGISRAVIEVPYIQGCRNSGYVLDCILLANKFSLLPFSFNISSCTVNTSRL